MEPEKLRFGLQGLSSLLQGLVWFHTKEGCVYLTWGRLDQELPVLSRTLQGLIGG